MATTLQKAGSFYLLDSCHAISRRLNRNCAMISSCIGSGSFVHTKLLWTFNISRRYNTTVMGHWRILIASVASLRTHVNTGYTWESLIMNGWLKLGRSWMAKGMSAVQNRAFTGPDDHNSLKLIKRCTCGKIFRRWLLLVERKLFMWQGLNGMFYSCIYFVDERFNLCFWNIADETEGE